MFAHMKSQVNSTVLTEISLSLETDVLKIFLVFSFDMFFSVISLCKVRGREVGFFLFLFFSLKSAWPIFGVYFCEYEYDQHISNKPVSSAYVQF